ncbi:MAG: glycosyltransferase [Flavobacteriaceae bacterium]
MARASKKIKVLFTIPDFDTAGSGKALLKIATRLNSQQFEPHIACMHDRGVFFKVVKDSGIPLHVFQYTTLMKPYYKGIWNSYKISKKLKEINPDIIHSFHFNADYSEPLAARLAGIKWVYSKKNMSWGGSSKNSWNIRTFLAHHIIYQNTDMKAQFFPKLRKTSLIPRGVDVEEFFPFSKKNNLLQKHQLIEADRIIIAVANLVPLKGIDVLIKAFSQSEVYNNNWKLLIVGDAENDYGKQLQQMIVHLKLQDKVVFTGKVLNVNEYLNLAELFVLPTVFKGEGSPVAMLEAMATGLCVLGSNLPGIKDQLEHYPEHMVEAGNVQLWKDKLIEFASLPPSELKVLGQKFYHDIHCNYQIANEVLKTEQVYHSVV